MNSTRNRFGFLSLLPLLAAASIANFSGGDPPERLGWECIPALTACGDPVPICIQPGEGEEDEGCEGSACGYCPEGPPPETCTANSNVFAYCTVLSPSHCSKRMIAVFRTDPVSGVRVCTGTPSNLQLCGIRTRCQTVRP